jgi:hypothetical protein
MTSDDSKRAIGKIVSVAADRFVVEMHAGTDNFTVVGFDDVHYVARLGSFLMIPTQTEYVVAEVVGLRESDSSVSKGGASGLDKASSSKFLDVVPVGMLPQQTSGRFRFGVSIFPSLYADALYALGQELDRIFDTDQPSEAVPVDDKGIPPIPAEATRYKAISIGQSVVFQGYDVKIQVDSFFGGHAAILGNTGSGKSCTVATILQSLFEKADEFNARGATFFIFDVNGEYEKALVPLSGKTGIEVKELTLDGTATAGKFRLPHWFLDVSEWELLLQASERTQLPVLRAALGMTRLFSKENEANKLAIKEHVVATCILETLSGADGDSPVSKMQRIASLLDRCNSNDLKRSILQTYGASLKYGNFAEGKENEFRNHVAAKLLADVVLPAFDGTPFSFNDLEGCLDLAILYEEAHGNRQIRDYCSQMVTRYKSLKDREEYEFLRYNLDASGDGSATPSVQAFLTDILGLKTKEDGYAKNHQIVILNMNTVDDEVVELVAAVISRMIFRLLRHASPRNRFPVHLLLEEAHRYIASTPSRHAVDANRIFERIAKEGRKYGLFLQVASQRPSELSKTVLSQCSNFVVHRIQNPDDLAHIRQMTPFISEAVLKRLPSLPKQHALVFGNSVNLPTTFRVRNASPTPWSGDAKIRELWFHEAGRKVELQLKADEPSEGDSTSGPSNQVSEGPDQDVPF